MRDPTSAEMMKRSGTEVVDAMVRFFRLTNLIQANNVELIAQVVKSSGQEREPERGCQRRGTSRKNSEADNEVESRKPLVPKTRAMIAQDEGISVSVQHWVKRHRM